MGIPPDYGAKAPRGVVLSTATSIANVVRVSGQAVRCMRWLAFKLQEPANRVVIPPVGYVRTTLTRTRSFAPGCGSLLLFRDGDSGQID